MKTERIHPIDMLTLSHQIRTKDPAWAPEIKRQLLLAFMAEWEALKSDFWVEDPQEYLYQLSMAVFGRADGVRI